MKLEKTKGWTIVQTMLLGAVLVLLLAFLLPNVFSLRISSNESRVKIRLKSLAKKLEAYKFKSAIDSYPADLNSIAAGVLKRAQDKPLIAGELSFEYSGYWFVYLPASRDSLVNIERYTFFCRPIKQNITGVNSFVMNEGATVYRDIGKHPATVDKFDVPIN